MDASDTAVELPSFAWKDAGPSPTSRFNINLRYYEVEAPGSFDYKMQVDLGGEVERILETLYDALTAVMTPLEFERYVRRGIAEQLLWHATWQVGYLPLLLAVGEEGDITGVQDTMRKSMMKLAKRARSLVGKHKSPSLGRRRPRFFYQKGA